MRPPMPIGPGIGADSRSGIRSGPTGACAATSAWRRCRRRCGRRPAPRRSCRRSSAARWSTTAPRSRPARIIIDTPNTYLYLVLGNGKAMRYGIGVGREGFTWAGAEKVTKMAEWPDWNPPAEMIERQPYLPRFMAGGEGNPLGARALYLGKTLYRIHGTNQPSTIGTFVSSGCIRLTNEDITDLYTRVKVGTRVVVLPGGKPPATAAATPIVAGRARALPPVSMAPARPLRLARCRARTAAVRRSVGPLRSCVARASPTHRATRACAAEIRSRDLIAARVRAALPRVTPARAPACRRGRRGCRRPRRRNRRGSSASPRSRDAA